MSARRAPPDGRTLGAVLAGGRSRRFGEDKALAVLGGERLLDRAVAVLRACCDDVVVVSSRPGHDVAGCPVVPDAREDVGPLAGMEAALGYGAATGAQRVFVLACDLPTVTPDAVRAVRDALGDAPAAALHRDGDPGFEPLCAVYRTDCASVVRTLLDEGRRSARSLFEHVGGRVVGGGASAGAPAVVNVNRPDDLRRAAAALEAPSGVPCGSGPTVVCVIGKKKSGKTTTVVGLVRELVARGYDVMTVKHGHGFDLDREGSDTWKHRHAGGAERVVAVGPDGFAVMGGWGKEDGHSEPPLETLVRRFAWDAEIVVAEGFKASAYPCIEVFRTAAHAAPIHGTSGSGDPERYVALITDLPDFPAAACPVLDANDPRRFEVLADLVARLHDA